MKHPSANREAQVTINGQSWFNAMYDHLGDDGYAYAWQATGDDYPPCWTDGVCWDSNEDNVASVEVIDLREIEV